MEVTALCIRLLMNVLFLLSALDQKVDSLSLRVNPKRVQFFQYENVTIHCDASYGSVQWKFAHKSKVEKPTCKITGWETSTGSSCIFKNLYPDDIGEYWCEDGEGKRSNNITITVTDGSVILDSPALPVMEGDAVTLRCRNKTFSSNLTAGFYKDGHLIRSNSTGEMIIRSVSKSDEGLYKCDISGAGESPESWLAVRCETLKGFSTASVNSLQPETHHSSDHVFLTLRAIIPIVLMAMLLVLLGVLHCGKLRVQHHKLVSTQMEMQLQQ